jgi:uncharacterized protein YbjQ (UPF0145 family)
MLKAVVVLAGALVVSGCGSFVPVVKIDQQPLEVRNKAMAMPIIGAGQKADYTVVTMVEGNSCKNKMWDPAATRTAAIEQIKFHALESGADAVANVQCGQREGTSTNTNCWELISCTAEAVRLVK